MAYTQTQLDILDKAIAQGVTRVEFGDKIIEYRSLNEMLRIRALMAQELGLNTKNANRTFGEFNKGLK